MSCARGRPWTAHASQWRMRSARGLNQRLLEPGGKALLLAEGPPQMLDDPVRLAHISLLPTV